MSESYPRIQNVYNAFVCRYVDEDSAPVRIPMYYSTKTGGADLAQPYRAHDPGWVALARVQSWIESRVPFIAVDSLAGSALEVMVSQTRDHVYVMFVKIPHSHPTFGAFLAPQESSPFRTLMLNQGTGDSVVPLLFLSDDQLRYVEEFYETVLDKPQDKLNLPICRAGYLEGEFPIYAQGVELTTQLVPCGVTYNPVGIFARPYWTGNRVILDYEDVLSARSAALPDYDIKFTRLSKERVDLWLSIVLGAQDDEIPPEVIRDAIEIRGPVRDSFNALLLRESIEIPTYREATIQMPRLTLQSYKSYVEPAIWLMLQGSKTSISI